MKKTLSLFLLTALLLSLIPFSLAEDSEIKVESDSEKTSIVAEDNTASETKVENKVAEREKVKEKIENLKAAREEKKENIQEKLREVNKKGIEGIDKLKERALLKYNENMGYKAREIGKEKIEELRKEVEKTKEKYEKAKTDLEEAKNKFKEKIELKKSCKETGDCNVTEEQLIEHAKKFLGNSANAIIEHLNKAKTKIQENEALTEEEAKEMTAKIDSKIVEIQAAKQQAENATTKEDIRQAAMKINASWKNIKTVTRAHSLIIANSHLGGVIAKSEKLNEKLQKIVTRMEENGKNTENIKPLVEEYKTKVNTAKEKYDLATQKYKEFWLAEGKPEAVEKLKEAQDLIKEAKQLLKEANEKLREIAKLARTEREEVEKETEKSQETEIEKENESEKNKTETESESQETSTNSAGEQ